MLYGQGVLRSPERVAAETAKGMSRNGSDAPALREIAEKNAGSDGAKSLESSDDNSYSGGKFIRKGTALSPIVTERRKGSGTSPHLMSHSRARSYSGTTQNPVTSPLASPHRRRRTQDHLDLAIHSSNHDDYSSVTRQNSLDSEGTVPLPLSQCYQMPASSPSARSATTSTTYIASEMGDDNNDGATDPYLQFTDFEKTKNQRIRKRPQSNLDPIYSGVMGPAETDLYTPKKKVRAPRLKVKTAKAPISGFKLFRYRLQLYFLYIFYTGWFVADLVFTVYVQAVKMGYPLEIKWEPLQKAVEWYHPYEGSWLEVGTVVAPKVVAFTWIWMSLTLFFLTIFSFKDEPDLEIEQFMDEEDYPTVDVFLPRYKEPWDIFRPTVAAALGLNYPESKLNVYVCDDGNRCGVGVKEELKENFYLGTRRNLHYLARPDGTHAKSGNLNHGLKHSRGDLVVVFDADMVADPAFLRKLIPHLLEWDKEQSIYYFGDTAFIQVTQCFYNENDWMVRLFDGTNLMFYALTMPGMNGKNAAPMVGTGFILQRTAINEVGGFVTAYSVEDVTTTLALHQRGWRSKYKHCRLVEGLSPATLQEFFKQRLRWGTGSAQLLRYIAPLTLRGLTWAQRLGNFSSHNYWAVVLVMWIFLMARYVLWLVYLYLTPAPDGVTENRRLSLLPTQFLPILVALLGLPNVPFLSKIQTMMSMLAFLPVYIRIAWLLVCGKLHPTKPRHGKLKVAASSESYGNYLPADAYFNVIVTLVVTAACVVFSALPNLGIGPQVKGYLYYVQLGTLLAWVWFSNFPMIYEVLKIAFCLSEEEEEDEEEEEEQKPSAPSHPSKTKALDKGSEDEAKVVINIKDLQVPPEKKNQGILSDVNRRAAIVVASPEGQVAPPTPRAGADLERITISSEEQDEVPSLPIRSPARISREHLSQISSPGHTKNLAHADGKEEDEFIGFPATTVKEAVAAPRGRRHSRTKSMSMASSSSSPGHARMPSNVVFYSPHPDNTLAKGLASPDSLEEA